FMPITAMAHSAYLLTITVNASDGRHEPLILYDKAGWGQNPAAHRQSQLGYFGDYKYASKALPGMQNATPAVVNEGLKGLDQKDYVVGGDGNPHLIYSFPGYHGTKATHDGTAKDLARAEWVANTMVQSLNDAIAFVAQKSGKKP